MAGDFGGKMALELLTPFTKVELEEEKKRPTVNKSGFWAVILTLFTTPIWW